MALATYHPFFLFLVLLEAVQAHVKPPTNVTLYCRSLHNVVMWSYDQAPPGLRFRVDYGSVSRTANAIWVEPPTLQADVSFLSEQSDEYFLTVSAVIGQNESDAVPSGGIIFSYFQDSQANQKCLIDFPPVNVTAQQDDIIKFRFIHPQLYHPKLHGRSDPKSRQNKSRHGSRKHLPIFKYDVVIINQKERHYSFNCTESVCEQTLPVEAAQKHCLKVSGELQKTSVQATQDYCALPFQKPLHETNIYTYVYIIVPVVLALGVLALVLYMVYWKKTRPSTSLPKSMAFMNRLQQWTLGVAQEQVLVPDVGPTSPTPLLTTDETESPPNDPSTTETVLRLPIRGVSTDEGVCDVVEVENNEEPGYMHGGNLEEDATLPFSEASFGYEKRPVLVEFAPDEQVEGYRG